MPPTGPTSPEGKAISARNSTRHGLRARAIVLPGESQDDWDAFERAYLEDLAPIGIGEEVLARRAAELQWRLRRVAAAERDAMDECAEDPGAYKSTASYRKSFGYKTPNVFPDRLPESLPAVSALNPLMRYEAHLSRQYQAAMRDLLAMQDRRRGNARTTRVEIHGFPGNITKPLAAVTIPAQPLQPADRTHDNVAQPSPAVSPPQTPDLPNELHLDEPHQYPRSLSSAGEGESATLSEHDDPSPIHDTLSSQRERVGPKGRGEGQPPKLPTEVPTELPPSAPTSELPGDILIDTIDRLRAYNKAAAADPSIYDDPNADSPRDIVVDAFARLKKHMPPGWRPPPEIARFIATDQFMPSIEDAIEDAFREDEEEENDPLRALTLPAWVDGG